jgi:DNA gyrase/topoisomerase IV subunit A
MTITAKIGIDAAQLEKIVSLPTFRWARDHYQTVLEKIKQLRTNIANHKATLASPKRLKQVFLDELDDLKHLKL